MSDNIYLVGFMGSGKSSVGALLARDLGRGFMDMDDVLEREFGRSIREVFEADGEDVFRNRETRLLERLSRRRGLVVATGGGVPERDGNRDIMKRSGRVVWLDTSLETCAGRVGREEREIRPLWENPAAVRELFEKRRPLYAGCDLAISTDGRTPEEISGEASVRLFPDERFTLRMDGVESDVVCTRFGPEALKDMLDGRRCVILTDRRVARLHLERYLDLLNAPQVITVSGGEKIKTMGGARNVLKTMLDHRYHRDDLLVALGGGTVTDLGAFVASVYKRGMPFILVSTTLLGCVDAAIGGKAAVNLGQGKNVVGCFTIPRGVVLDAKSLGTLDRSRISEGLIEAYKTGLVADPSLADLIEGHGDRLLKKDMPLMTEVVRLSALAKADVVSSDFTEQGRRRILNFGHTYGHAVEGWHDYRISHGRAVAVGMRVAARLSGLRGLLEPDKMERIMDTVHRLSPRDTSHPPVEKAWEIMQHDKKITGGRLIFVLLAGAGRPVVVDDVTLPELKRAVEEN